jgi:hypothetical protein
MSSLIANRSKSIPNVIRFVNRCSKLVYTGTNASPSASRIPRAKIFPPKHDNPARLDGGALQMKSAANVSQQLSRAKKTAKPKIQPAKPAI